MEVLTLKWNNYQNVLSYHISELRKKAFYTDATIACNGKFYNVHKFVLSMCSDYFNSIFIQTTCKNPVIIIKDIRCKDIEYLLNYMYTGEVNVRQNELASLIISAETLQIKGLAVSDENYLSLDKEKNNSENFRSECSENKPFVHINKEKRYSKKIESLSHASLNNVKSENLTEQQASDICLDLMEGHSPQKQIDQARNFYSPENLKNISLSLDNAAAKTPPRYKESLLDLTLHDKVKIELLELPAQENCSALTGSPLCHSECSRSNEDNSTNFLFKDSSDVFNQVCEKIYTAIIGPKFNG